MDAMNPQPIDHAGDKVQAYRTELVKRITQVVREDGRVEPLPGLFFNRISTLKRLHSVSEPCFCIVAQGSKDEILLGDARRALPVRPCALPALHRRVCPSSARSSKRRRSSGTLPQPSLRSRPDPALVSSVMVEAGHVGISSTQSQANVRVWGPSRTSAGPLDDTLLAGRGGFAAGSARGNGHAGRSALPGASPDHAGSKSSTAS